MTIKLVSLAVLAIFAGLLFIGTGIYFLSPKFLSKLNESNNDRKNEFRAKGSGLTAISLGMLTIVWGIALFSFPQIAAVLALLYMFFLVLAFAVLMTVFK